MDIHTLKDLEIFETTDSPKSLFDWMDCTLTPGGSYALKHRFQHPFHHPDEIRATQQVVKYFIEHINEQDLKTCLSEVKFIEEYLSSNIMIAEISDGWVSHIMARWYKYKYPDHFHFILDGVQNTCLFSKKIQHFLLPHIKHDCPEYLKTLYLKVQEIIQLLPEKEQQFSIIKTLRYDKLIRQVHLQKINNLLSSFYEVDALFAMAKSCRIHHLVFPEITDRPQHLMIQDLRHLFLANGVGNDFNPGGKNFVFLTGPNMSGKTTFIKALSTAVWMAHTGMGIPAKNGTIPVFDEVFTYINISDSLHKKQSLFVSEVMRIKELAMLLQAGKKVFAVMDELFRGTNLKDAVDCSQLVISGLSGWKNSFFILSTHLTALTESFRENAGISFQKFETFLENGFPKFTYKIKQGISHECLGVYILKEYQIPYLLTPREK